MGTPPAAGTRANPALSRLSGAQERSQPVASPGNQRAWRSTTRSQERVSVRRFILLRSMTRGISQVYRGSIATCSADLNPAICYEQRCPRRLGHLPSVHASSGNYGPYLSLPRTPDRRSRSGRCCCPAGAGRGPHPYLLHVCSDVPVRPVADSTTRQPVSRVAVQPGTS
jgi:hypothetical protein